MLRFLMGCHRVPGRVSQLLGVAAGCVAPVGGVTPFPAFARGSLPGAVRPGWLRQVLREPVPPSGTRR